MITEKQAIEYSLIKWEYASKTGCDAAELNKWLEKKHNKIYMCYNECGFCEIFMSRNGLYKYDCSACPLYKSWGMSCVDENNSYMKWAQAMTIKTRKKYALKIYKDIQKIAGG